jgi:hypothetical protein
VARPPKGLCSFRRDVAYSVRSSLFRLRHQRHVRCHAPGILRLVDGALDSRARPKTLVASRTRDAFRFRRRPDQYFGITLLPLLAVYTLARDRRCWRQLLWFCFPIVAVAIYDFLSQAQYGHALFVSAGNYSREVAAKYKVPLPAQIFTGLAFVGGCIFSVAFFVPIRWRRFLIGAAILLFLALVAAFYFFVPRQSHYQVNKVLICAEGAAFAAAGLGILALALIDLWRKRDADSLHLWDIFVLDLFQLVHHRPHDLADGPCGCDSVRFSNGVHVRLTLRAQKFIPAM